MMLKRIFIAAIKTALYPFSFLTIRSKKKWLFGSNMGFSSNAKYFFLECANNKDLRYIWIGNAVEVNLVRELGFEAYESCSVKGLYHTLTSAVYIYNSYASDINMYTSGSAYMVNLWHGLPIKNIERKVTFGKLNQIFKSKNIFLKIYYLQFFLKPDLFLSTSKKMTDYFSECFGITIDKCIEILSPRCNLFFMNKVKLMEYIDKYEKDVKEIIHKLEHSKYTYVYMPTFRDSNADVFTHSGINLEVLNETLKNQQNFMLIKLHPICEINFPLDKLSNVIVMDSKSDIYPILPFTDCLITDYSSILYDYILMKDKDVILYTYDYEEYISTSRDFAFPFDENTCGTRVDNFNSLIDLITTKANDDKNYRKKINDVRDMFWSKKIGLTGDLHKRIVKDIKL